MTELGDELIDAAAEILLEVGVSRQWKIIEGTNDVATGEKRVVQRNEFVTASPLVNVTQDFVGQQAEGGQLVKSTDFLVTIAAKGLTFTPKPGDSLVVDSKEFRALIVLPAYADERPVTYRIVLSASS